MLILMAEEFTIPIHQQSPTVQFPVTQLLFLVILILQVIVVLMFMLMFMAEEFTIPIHQQSPTVQFPTTQ
jgi:hypothetical protein